MNHPTGLLLSGGGAKGAFQIGAWKALAEQHRLDHVTAAAGCSVGALNAVLFALGDWELAAQIWLSLRPEDLLSDGGNGALFSRKGLIRLLHEIPLEAVSNAPIAIHVSVYHTARRCTEYHQLNGLCAEDIRTLLLASSAIPGIFRPESYQDGTYLDGGLTPEGDHCVPALYAHGHRSMILVSLNHEFSLYGVQNSRFARLGRHNLAEQYPDCSFTVCKPLQSMGTMLSGTLDFTPEHLRSRMMQGYRDTLALLEHTTFYNGDIGSINAALTAKMQRVFDSAAAIQVFLERYQERFCNNLPFPTMGGKLWYNDVFAIEDWRIQHHRAPGFRQHYRILDPNQIRRAWIMDPHMLLDALNDFGAFRQIECKNS